MSEKVQFSAKYERYDTVRGEEETKAGVEEMGSGEAKKEKA